eukprot:TRINITY_DN7236_c0_g1_i1.p1 TRINITY_DN7236_c0_g1~~TRINITY_DN7236_c0_g1_i1.p1  ORF type:complete len:115 (+),score=29.19 TRINITY_DN7236_c0_g1_i1:89-433(+)
MALLLIFVSCDNPTKALKWCSRNTTLRPWHVFGDLHTAMLGKPHKMDDTVALDPEFMFVENAVTGDPRELVVLQARPYQVHESTSSTVDYHGLLRSSIFTHQFDEKNYSFQFKC